MCFGIQNAPAAEKAKESRCPRVADSGIYIVRPGMRSDHHAALFGLKGQLVAEVGMRDGDELAGTLTEAAAAQVRHAVLGDNIIDVVLARRDDGARREDGLDLADRAALGRGGEGNEALAAAGLAGNFLFDEMIF